MLLSAGDLDPTFGIGGAVATDFGSGRAGEFEFANAIAIHADGKILAVGVHVTSVFPTLNDFAIARYNPDGSLDTSFDGDGTVTTDFDGRSEAASAVALQPDGKIVVAGGSVNFSNDFALARYNTAACWRPSWAIA